MEWTEKVLVPDLEATRVLSDNPLDADKCWNCNKGIDCEDCEDLTSITSDYIIKEIKMAQVVLCGIPVGAPYRIND